MDINTLKEYVRLNLRRLSPSATDCSDQTLYRDFADTAHEIKQLSYEVKKFYSDTQKGGEERFRFADISIISFLLMSIPMLLAAPGIGEMIFGNQGGAAIGYFLTLAILIVRIFLQGFAPQFRVGTIAHFLRIVLLVICGYFHIFKQTTFFGTTGIWVFVYIIFGSLITLFIRSFDIKRVKEHQSEFSAFLGKIDKLDSLSDKCVPLYAKIADKAESALESFIKTNNLHVTPTKRTLWFRFRRDPEKSAWGNKSTVNFEAPFEEKCEQETRGFDYRDAQDKHGMRFYKKDASGTGRKLCKEGTLALDKLIITHTYVNSQEFGWTDISERAAKKLFSDGKIYPYYGMELPEFLPELKYSFFRHYYDLTIETITYTTEVKSVPSSVESEAQKAFRAECGFEEAVHHYYDIQRSKDSDVQRKVDEYEEKKWATYRALCDYEEITSTSQNESTEHKKADEIGGLLVFTPDGKLVGAYAGDTEQSLEFLKNELKKYTDFVPDIYSQPFGYTQTQVMRRRYFS